MVYVLVIDYESRYRCRIFARVYRLANPIANLFDDDEAGFYYDFYYGFRWSYTTRSENRVCVYAGHHANRCDYAFVSVAIGYGCTTAKVNLMSTSISTCRFD